MEKRRITCSCANVLFFIIIICISWCKKCNTMTITRRNKEQHVCSIYYFSNAYAATNTKYLILQIDYKYFLVFYTHMAHFCSNATQNKHLGGFVGVIFDWNITSNSQLFTYLCPPSVETDRFTHDNNVSVTMSVNCSKTHSWKWKLSWSIWNYTEPVLRLDLRIQINNFCSWFLHNILLLLLNINEYVCIYWE